MSSNQPIITLAEGFTFGAIAAILFTILLIASAAVFNTRAHQAYCEAQKNWLQAKANYFNARAANLNYQSECTPSSDALTDIAEAISDKNHGSFSYGTTRNARRTRNL